MHIIKLSAIDSTNTYLKELSLSSLPKDYTVVTADEQTKGRGQMGTQWQSQKSRNLMFSVFKDVSFLQIDKQFYISMVVSLAIYKALKQLNIPKLAIKWPNDILAEQKKVAGILIENVIKNNQLQGSIIGIGINVNQKYFDSLPQVSSLHLLTGIVYNRDEVLSIVLKQFEYYFSILKTKKYKAIKSRYEDLLFRKKKPSTFETCNNERFSGYITGVDDDGKLQITVEDSLIKTFNFKEVRLLY